MATPLFWMKVWLKLPLPFQIGGDGIQIGLPLIEHQEVIAGKEEQLVLDDRAGDRAAKLVHLKADSGPGALALLELVLALRASLRSR